MNNRDRLTRSQIEQMVNRASWPVAFREDCQNLKLTPWQLIEVCFSANGPKVESTAAQRVERDPTKLSVPDLTQDELTSEMARYSETCLYDTLTERMKEFVDTAPTQWKKKDMSQDARDFAETTLELCRKRERQLRARGTWRD